MRDEDSGGSGVGVLFELGDLLEGLSDGLVDGLIGLLVILVGLGEFLRTLGGADFGEWARDAGDFEEFAQGDVVCVLPYGIGVVDEPLEGGESLSCFGVGISPEEELSAVGEGGDAQGFVFGWVDMEVSVLV